MKDRQRRFADEYLIDLNAEAAAVRAGYSPRYARGNAYKLVARSGIKEYIEKRMAEKESELIADQNEVLRYLTAVMRGESTSEEIIVEGIGDGRSKARKLEKTPSEKDRLKAAELIGKRYGLFTDKTWLKGMPPQVLKTILGHSSLAMTMDLYSHVLPDTKAEEMQKIAIMF